MMPLFMCMNQSFSTKLLNPRINTIETDRPRPRPRNRGFRTGEDDDEDDSIQRRLTMLPVFARKYVLAGLTGSPDVLEALLKDVGPNDPAWDKRPDPERFTIREVLAHLADWEGIFLA